ncbi:hypothetical protein HPB52_012460 [Rhipicephalus sanguineus]|uniref:Uncharacterized protein n=1 Tax=Rhipicephalus sanguineus TaxID=34632 RepID=A0A9D4T4B3_RHISA|nr:hypothetical protein HPB52_012460 [Rhipicephalus sanguineus]
MHSNGCPQHESSRRTECTSALKVSPSRRAMSDSCASNPRVKQPRRLGKIVPQLFNTMCCQRQRGKEQCSSTETSPSAADTTARMSGPTASSSYVPATLGRGSQRRRGRPAATPAPTATVDAATTLGAPTTTAVDPTAQQRYPLREKYSDAAKGNSDN